MSDATLNPAPGAKAAKVCGILAIVFALTCVGFPMAIILGIVALVQQGKAKRLAKAEPNVYASVPATGLVTGIIGLVLPVLMVPILGIASAIAIPAFLAQRDRAREIAVRSNLELARAQAEAIVEALHAKAPGQVPSQDGIIQTLAMDPAIQALRNPITPSAPALQRGTAGALGTVMVSSDQQVAGSITTWVIRFRAVAKRGGEDRVFEGEVITHTQVQAQGRTEDGWEVVPPPAEEPAPKP
jgi:type II secretory pathway pseudopilin PulG